MDLAGMDGLKTCCAGEDFEIVNITKGATVVVRGVSDMVSKLDDVLTNGTDVEAHVVGTGLYIPDAEDETTGVWLEKPDGTICATARVTESTSATLTCVFAEIALPEGQWQGLANGSDSFLWKKNLCQKATCTIQPMTANIFGN